MTAPSVNSGEIEGGFQVNGASGAENAFTVDGVVTNSLINGSLAPEHGVRVPAGSAGQDDGHRGGVRRRARRRHQRGDQVGRQHVPRRSALLYEGAGLSAGPVKRLVLDPSDDLTVTYQQDDQGPAITAAKSAGRSAVRSSRTGCSSSDPYSPRFSRRTNDYRFSNGTENGEIARKQTLTQAFGKVTYSSSRVTASGSALFTPTTSEGTLPAYNGAGAEHPHQLRGGQRGQPASAASSRRRPTPAATSTSSCRTRRSCRSAAATSTTTTTTRASRTRRTTSIRRRRSAWPASRRTCRGPINTQNTPRALIVEKDADRPQLLQRRLQQRVPRRAATTR